MLTKAADFKHLEGKSLLSMDECLEAFRKMKIRRNEFDTEPGASNVVFIDASWWHKGSLNGRKM